MRDIEIMNQVWISEVASFHQSRKTKTKQTKKTTQANKKTSDTT